MEIISSIKFFLQKKRKRKKRTKLEGLQENKKNPIGWELFLQLKIKEKGKKRTKLKGFQENR